MQAPPRDEHSPSRLHSLVAAQALDGWAGAGFVGLWGLRGGPATGALEVPGVGSVAAGASVATSAGADGGSGLAGA